MFFLCKPRESESLHSEKGATLAFSPFSQNPDFSKLSKTCWVKG